MVVDVSGRTGRLGHSRGDIPHTGKTTGCETRGVAGGRGGGREGEDGSMDGWEGGIEDKSGNGRSKHNGVAKFRSREGIDVRWNSHGPSVTA